jgi:hypothetical protein
MTGSYGRLPDVFQTDIHPVAGAVVLAAGPADVTIAGVLAKNLKITGAAKITAGLTYSQ